MISLTTIREYAKSISPEDIGRAHKCFDGSTPFYMVQSSRDALVEHKVTWDREHGFRCCCESGQIGFSNCKKGVCQHAIIAVAAAAEEQAAMKEQEELNRRAAIAPVPRIEDTLPAWMLTNRVEPHMRKRPVEL